MENRDTAFRGNDPILKVVLIIILTFSTITLTLEENQCSLKESFWQPQRHGYTDACPSLYKFNEELRQLRNNPALQRSTAVLNIIYQWNAFVSGQMKRLNAIKPEQIRMLTKNYDNLTCTFQNWTIKLMSKIDQIESVIGLKCDDETDCLSLQEAPPNEIDKVHNDLKVLYKIFETLNLSLCEQKSVLENVNGSIKTALKDLNETTEQQKIAVEAIGVRMKTESENIQKLNMTVDEQKVATEKHIKTQSCKLGKINETLEEQKHEIKRLNVNITTGTEELAVLKTTVKEHKLAIGRVNVSVETEIDNFRKLNRTVDEQDTAIERLNASMNRTETDQEQIIKTLTTLEEIVKKLEKGSKAVMTDVETQSETNQQNTEQISKTLKTLSDRMTTMEETMSGYRRQVGVLNSTAVDVHDLTNENNRAIKEQEEIADSRYEEFRQLKEFANEMQNRMKYYEVALFVLIVVPLCIGLWRFLKKWNEQSSFVRQTTSNTRKTRRENTDTYNLKWEGPMENSVCVVSFNSETKSQHATEIISIFESTSAKSPGIYSHVIRCHADIRDLPGSRVFLVFVDFNERNVILEDPDKGLGDLRLITVKSLWKFGGDVFVIYYRDKGSRNLTGELYNQDLASINNQSELTQLKNQHRMLSIYQHFSDFQKQHCRKIINEQLFKA